MYHNKGIKEKRYNLYLKHLEVMNEYKILGHLSDEEFDNKIDKLKKHYEVE